MRDALVPKHGAAGCDGDVLKPPNDLLVLSWPNGTEVADADGWCERGNVWASVRVLRPP